jgi:hypothetical protein
MNLKSLLVLAAITALLLGGVVYTVDDYLASPLGTVSRGQQLTERENTEVIRIALSDPGVQAEFRGKNYTMSSVGTFAEGWNGFERAYPEVQFIMPDQHCWIAAIVDQRHGKVRYIWHDVLPVLPPDGPPGGG